ncbi:hypothetical protein QY95_00117 [Bacillus thermotolerans]|uniref:Uncharacterized protein n=1 Tax=Bacillus thermotolerans TaxID=1221996 RepID=A0A0F5IA02_BACTR|nr:hypothetical protein QY95_00117 [Bacillus thermotolerans]
MARRSRTAGFFMRNQEGYFRMILSEEKRTNKKRDENIMT